jgi:selenide,water dikinase
MSEQKARLTGMVTGGGCAAKLGPVDLSAAVRQLTQARSDPNVIVGYSTMDDAGVYRIDARRAIVQTIDFITPIVDDPFTFGEIAATNAVSDVYAMGGQPLTGLNVVCFPRGSDLTILEEILRGGLAAMERAGVALLGGHSVDDPEIKYGVSVTGMIDPERIWTNSGAKPGDALVLTKAIGVGTITSGLKEGKASDESVRAATESMRTLNKSARDIGQDHDVHACVDVTGFGLLGHLWHIARESKVTVEIASGDVPLLPGALELAREGIGPGGLRRNKAYAGPHTMVDADVEPALADLFYDPQTSGGLLLVVPGNQSAGLVSELRAAGAPAGCIGTVLETSEGAICVRP